MSKVIYEPAPRFVVEVANTVSHIRGERMQGAWNFEHAFALASDAEALAKRLAEDNEFVRVIDRTPAELNEEKN